MHGGGGGFSGGGGNRGCRGGRQSGGPNGSVMSVVTRQPFFQWNDNFLRNLSHVIAVSVLVNCALDISFMT